LSRPRTRQPTGLQLGTSGSPTADQSVTYGYDTYGRFNSLAGGGQTFSYGYATNSNLIASIADTASGWTQTCSYVTNRDLLDVIETKISSTTKSRFDYGHDNLGRRTSVAKTGEMYARYGNGTQGLDTAWGYDDRSQLTSEITKLGGSSTVLTGRDDAYAFDNLGNRSTATHNSQLTTYTSTLLNTYSQRTVPGVFDVAGAAGSGTTVTVNGSSSGVTRHGEYFFKGHGLANNPNPVFSTLAISDGTTTANIAAFLAGTPEAFTYDDDGNLLSDGRWDYTYDAENRLISMQTKVGAVIPNGPIPQADARRLEFKNDYLGRRVEKTVRDGWNGSTFATVVSDEKFVYDGWNCIAKLNASSLSLIASYFWGLDWSGTLQGAGGVGGLALTVEAGNTYLPAYDGNGNVMGMIKASDGSLAAAYEYDAFGNTLRESGPYAASNPFRFSTKYTDIETGLIYYGLRYYSPTLGRFLNKDPIEEQGGLNLYGFCSNDAINKWDYLGMVVITVGRAAGVTGGFSFFPFAPGGFGHLEVSGGIAFSTKGLWDTRLYYSGQAAATPAGLGIAIPSPSISTTYGIARSAETGVHNSLTLHGEFSVPAGTQPVTVTGSFDVNMDGVSGAAGKVGIAEASGLYVMVAPAANTTYYTPTAGEAANAAIRSGTRGLVSGARVANRAMMAGVRGLVGVAKFFARLSSDGGTQQSGSSDVEYHLPTYSVTAIQGQTQPLVGKSGTNAAPKTEAQKAAEKREQERRAANEQSINDFFLMLNLIGGIKQGPDYVPPPGPAR
jgi:RHS repeat-associated protein